MIYSSFQLSSTNTSSRYAVDGGEGWWYIKVIVMCVFLVSMYMQDERIYDNKEKQENDRKTLSRGGSPNCNDNVLPKSKSGFRMC